MFVMDAHPLIDGLIRELPAPGEAFPQARRKAWLACAAAIFDLIYTEPQGGLVHTAPAASEGAHNPTSDAPIPTAPTLSPARVGDDRVTDHAQQSAAAKAVAQEPSEPEGSAGVQDRCESTPAPHSAQAEAPEAGVSEHPEAHSMATGGKQDAGTSASGHENADPPVSAGGRAEIDASPAAPISETTGPRPSAGEAAASPAPSLMERVVECRKAHPDWPAKMVAEHVGAAKSTVMTYGYRAGFGWKTEAQYRAAQQPPQPAAEPPEPVEPPSPAPTLVPPPAAKSDPKTPTANDGNSGIRASILKLHSLAPYLDSYEAALRAGVAPIALRSFSAEMGLVWNQPREDIATDARQTA